MMSVAEAVVPLVACTCGWTAIAYERYAARRGWPVGALLSGPISWLQALGWAALIGALVASWWLGSWWSPLAVIAISIFATRFILDVFGPASQIIASLGTVAGLGLCIALLLR